MDAAEMMERVNNLNERMNSLQSYPNGKLLTKTGIWEERGRNGFFRSKTNQEKYCVWVNTHNSPYVEIFFNNGPILNLAGIAESDLKYLDERLDEAEIWMMEAEV